MSARKTKLDRPAFFFPKSHILAKMLISMWLLHISLGFCFAIPLPRPYLCFNASVPLQNVNMYSV